MSHLVQPGMFGAAAKTLAPSVWAVGPNTYLGRKDFLKMLGIALMVHALVFGIASLFPGQKVTNIPVRALSFKLGDQDRIAAYAPVPSAMRMAAAPVMQAPAQHITPMAPPVQHKPTPAPTPVKPQKITPQEQPRQQPVEHVEAAPATTPPDTAPLTQPTPAIAPQPQQYVREVGQAPVALPSTAALTGLPSGTVGGQAAETSQTAQTTEMIRQRYEQQISSWIEHHKIYPASANGKLGRVVVRMRIDRAGTVRYYALEQSSGNAAIDTAAIDMVRRANPVPAAPANYPAGNLIEFLIPISFQAPS